MKKHEYIAKVNTGDVLGADTKRGLYANLKHYFANVPEAFYAEVLIDNIPRAFAWKVPSGISVIQIIE